MAPICLPRKFEELAEMCACNQRWLKMTKLGSGAFGKVHRACRLEGGGQYVVKVQPDDNNSRAEVQAYLALAKLRITPKMHAAWSCKGKLYIVLERLVECTRSPEQTLKRVEVLLDRMEQNGWLHGDVHSGNVMCTHSNRVVLLDFGLSVQRGKAPYKHRPGRTYAQIKREQQLQLRDFLDDEESTQTH